MHTTYSKFKIGKPPPEHAQYIVGGSTFAVSIETQNLDRLYRLVENQKSLYDIPHILKRDHVLHGHLR